MLRWLRRRSPSDAPVPAGARFRRSPGVAATADGDRTVLLDADGGTYFGLDGVGSRVWELLEEPASPASLGGALAAEYDAPRERIEADCAALLGRLRAHGLVEPA